MPDLIFKVESAEPLEYAAVPSLLFKLRIENRGAEPIRSVTLNTQLRIAANRRSYNEAEQAGLVELFGAPSRWSDTLKSLLWTLAVTPIAAFEESTLVDLIVPCTYDFEVTTAKYFHSLQEGEIPLEFLFSGTMFYTGENGLQVAQISWDKEAQFRLPVSVWKEMMEHYFPNSAWLRLGRDSFDRFYRYKAERGHTSWEAALDELLDEQPLEGKS